MYESDITENIEALRGEIPIEIVYRHHYDSTKNYNLELVYDYLLRQLFELHFQYYLYRD